MSGEDHPRGERTQSPRNQPTRKQAVSPRESRPSGQQVQAEVAISGSSATQGERRSTQQTTPIGLQLLSKVLAEGDPRLLELSLVRLTLDRWIRLLGLDGQGGGAGCCARFIFTRSEHFRLNRSANAIVTLNTLHTMRILRLLSGARVPLSGA